MPFRANLRLTVALLVMGVAGVFLAALAASGSAAVSQSPRGLPACTAGNAVALRSGYAQWQDTLLDPGFELPPGYMPPDLKRDTVIGQRVVLRAFVFDPLRRMLDVAASEGVTITVTSAYRSYSEQVALEQTLGRVDELVARAGHSEHQLGTAVDLRGGANWLQANAPEFGFVLSYPADRPASAICYQPEPWHYRYMGLGRAQAIALSGLSVREWLWQHEE